jgi:hypothetical protein
MFMEGNMSKPLYPHIPKSQQSNVIQSPSADVILYHGTTLDRAKSIMQRGLQPSPYEPNLTTDFKAAYSFGLLRAGEQIPLFPGEPQWGSGPRPAHFVAERNRLAKPNTAVVEFILSYREMQEFQCGINQTLGGCLKWLKVPRMRIITSDNLE